MKNFVIWSILLSLFPLSIAKAEWVGTWSASPQPLKNTISFANQTVRQIIRISAGGKQIRLKLSNLFGLEAVHFKSIHVALADEKRNAKSRTSHRLHFHGAGSLTLEAKEEIWSDPIQMTVPSRGEIVVSLYFQAETIPFTFHSVSSSTTFISTPGDYSLNAVMPVVSTTESWYFISDVAVEASSSAIVTLGDSITDGVCSKVNTNTRWPDIFANRLLEAKKKNTVLNQGIGYNRVLLDQPDLNQPSISALARFDHDVLSQPGVRHVIVLEGINDIGMAAANADATQMANAIIQGHQQMITKAHQHGLFIYGATLLPIGGSGMDKVEKQEMRAIVNDWIRHHAPYDAVIDFDAAVRDPEDDQRLFSGYDCGDHVHPNSAGYQAMANSIDLNLF